VNQGIDIRNKAAVDGWRHDASSHGTHCAGVIGGSQLSNVHVRGIAPEAELIACKVFPGGHFSDLVDAVDYCISQQVDVINLCLASQHTSEIVEQKLAEAKAQGVACIVAAGNTGGPVQFPARSRHVLAVSAIGKLNEFPNHTYHAQTVMGDRHTFGSDGYFAAKFSCHGEQIAVCGPGVAVISTVSPSNFAVLDGTSLAAAHISGLATLILAHHPDFKARYHTRNALRVERLFEIIRQSARPLHVGDVRRVGAGLPDAWRALGLDLNASKAVRESVNTSCQVLREQLRSAGLSGDGEFVGSQRSASRTTAHAVYRNGVARPTSSHAVHGSSRIISALLLSELRKHMEEAQLIAAEPEAPRAVAEAE
jgi:subtilisin family serine protease